MPNDTAASDGVRFGLWYDFRNPAQWRQPFESFYAERLEQIAWAEEIGFNSVWLTEHHFCDDGYAPSPLVIAGAIGARTKKMQISTNLMLPALHNPIRLAEDAATLGILTDGRFDLGVAIGYRELEFEAFGQRLINRTSLLEETVAIARKAWAGESVAFEGRRYNIPDVRVQPSPARTPLLLIGGMVEPAIERVARIGDGFLSTQNTHHEMYIDALKQLGRDPAEGRIYAGQWTIISEDPDRTWASIGDHAVYQLNEYIGWGAFGPPDEVPRFADRDQVVVGGGYALSDGPAAVDQLVEMLQARPQIRDVHFWAQLPGEPVESGSERMEYIAKHVIPEVRSRLSVGAAPARAGS